MLGKASRTFSVVLVLLVVLFGSIALYYGTALNAETAKVAALQQATDQLQRNNSQLEQRLSSLNHFTSNGSALGFSPVEVYESANRSVVTIQGFKAGTVLTFFGPQQEIESVIRSGFVIDYADSYYILTNFHVVDGIVNATVTFWDGDAYPANVVGSDALSDLAVLSVNASSSDIYSLDLISSSSSLKVRVPVVAIGSPFGLSGSITFGIISQLGRTIQYQSTSGSFPIADMIQFSAPINPGNSGGPLLDADGFVVGITSAAVSGSQGVGFAIPSDTILRELPFLISTGKYDRHPYIGIQAVDMNYQLSQAAGTNITYGLLIEKTQPGGPADKAGLRGGSQLISVAGRQYTLGGDIIVSIDGVRIVNYDVFSTYLERHAVLGQVIQVGIIRSGQFQVVQVVVGSRPS
jgi:S1-C subfamily serine protease